MADSSIPPPFSFELVENVREELAKGEEMMRLAITLDQDRRVMKPVTRVNAYPVSYVR